MTTTRSGRLLAPRNYGVPTLHDIAVQSARIPRFAGAHRAPYWSVAHHLLVVSDALRTIMQALDHEPLMAVALLHDADELATSDVPTLWKPPELREAAQALRDNVYREYVGRLPTQAEDDAIKAVDRAALWAEGKVVGPPGVLVHAGLEGRRFRWAGATINDDMEAIVARVRDTYPDPGDQPRLAEALEGRLVAAIGNPNEEDA